MTNEPKILTTNEAAACVCASHAHFYAFWLKEPGFPKCIKLGLRKNGWFRAEIEAFLAARAEVAA